MDGNRLIRLTRPIAIVLWLVVAATVLVHRSESARFQLWAASWAIGFAARMVASIKRAPPTLALASLGLEGLAVAAMTALLSGRFEGLLLVPIALELWFRLGPRLASLWVFAQTARFGAGVALHWNARSAWMLALPYGALQALVLAVSAAFHREKSMRTELATAHQELECAHQELQALGPVLEQGSRNAERVRMSRELHDATGHRLTALALQLEVASHTADGSARDRIETAQRVVRELIDDMHRIVTAADLTDSEGLAAALRELARNFPRPVVHLALPEHLRIADAERAHVPLRCSQEILNNSARHSGAQNLWLEITQSDGELHLRARDDGTVASRLQAGSGLRGMQRRFQGLGGTLRYEPAPQGGLEILASLPNPLA